MKRVQDQTQEGSLTQMEVLVSSVAELLAGAVHEVLRLMGQAVSQHREEWARVHRENRELQRTLQELRAKLRGSDVVQQDPGAGMGPRTAPGSPAHDPSERPPDPRSRSASPVVTETPGALSRAKAEPGSEGPAAEVAVGGASARDPPRPPGAAERRDRTHGCHVCGRSFAPACHSGERPHACARCRLRCSRPSDPRKHERVHTAERPHNCSLCGRRFNRAENLRRHTKKVHHGTLV